MRLRMAVRLLVLAGVLGTVVWACGSGTTARDVNYGTDAGSGYKGPDGSLSDALGEEAGGSDGGADAEAGTGVGDAGAGGDGGGG